jgi:predicted AlkP superfamily phosphohydrolase/phosphomutase
MSEQIIVVGLDGATFDLILPWVQEGLLPNMARMLREGAAGTLLSTVPPMTAQAWTTFMTGKNMGKHGVVDFVMRRPEGYGLQMVNAASRRSETLWGYLSGLGMQVGVLNMPMTYPPEPVNGFLVSGMDTPSDESCFTYPPELQEELQARFPGYTIETRSFPLVYGPRQDRGRLLQELIHSEEERYQVGQFLRSRFPCDLFVVVFRSTDLAQHWFWKSMDPAHPHRQPGDEQYTQAILQVYQHVDQLIGRYMAEKKTLVVLSDHGSGPVGDRVVYLNTWLRDQGWLSFQSTHLQRFRGQFLIKGVWKMWRRVRSTAPPWLRKLLLGRFSGMRRQLPSLFALSDIDWSRTRAYSVEVRGTIWINLKGREPEGIVESGAEYEALRDEIAQQLLELRDPVTSSPLVAQVYRREELYHGPYLDLVPDLLVVWVSEPYSPLTLHGSLSRRKRPVEVLDANQLARLTRPNGSHRLNGVCTLWGEHVAHGARIEQARLQDVASTILYRMGVPIPSDMDGRVLSEAFDPGYVAHNPVQYVEGALDVAGERRGYGADEEKQVLDRLSDLGYI